MGLAEVNTLVDPTPADQIRVMAFAYSEFALGFPEQYRVLFMSGLPTETETLGSSRSRCGRGPRGGVAVHSP